MPKTAISECVKAAQILHEVRLKKFKPVPKDWFTLEQFMETADCSRSRAHTALSELRKLDKINSKKWSRLDSNGRTSYITIYKTK